MPTLFQREIDPGLVFILDEDTLIPSHPHNNKESNRFHTAQKRQDVLMGELGLHANPFHITHKGNVHPYSGWSRMRDDEEFHRDAEIPYEWKEQVTTTIIKI